MRSRGRILHLHLDIAEFYRVEAVLVQSGLQVTSARGLTDEGDPWFVFCRAEDDEVIIHFARIDGRYIISSPAYCGNAAGYDFRALVRGMIERHPVLRPKPSGDNLFMHPAALLVMLVATAFLKSGHAAEAASGNGNGGATSGASDAAADVKSRAAAAVVMASAATPVTLDATQETLLLSAINAAMVASVPEHTISGATSPAPITGPDGSDNPLTSLASVIPMDRPHDMPVVASSGMSPFPVSQSVVVAPVDPTTPAPAHGTAPIDTVAIKLSSPDPLHYQLQSDALPPPGAITPFDATPASTPSVLHVSLSGLSEIPHADKVLLQALGVPDTVAYAPTAPAAISTVIDAGVHTAAINDAERPATPSVPEAAAVTSNAAPNPLPDTVRVPVSSSDPGAAVAQGGSGVMAPPDIAAVMRIVLAFEAVEAQPTVLLNDHGIIFYDAAAINGHYSAVKSVTYDFGDGFSISLVGLPVELTHAGAHV